METPLIPSGVQRCPTWQFAIWMAAAGAVVLWGVYAMILVWWKGLNQTHMNDAYGFALWIWADLAVIALGGGAFFTGFLTYILGKKNLNGIINFAVVIGFICYSSALLILAVDIGQPLRGWFIFWHANVHSMLTEVAFCLSCYFGVLFIEFIPLILENPRLAAKPFLHHLSHNLHELMAVFAGTGVFLSFFHQGSLGGLSGVLFGRPFAYREGIFIWPWTFFLFVWSAAACGPCFTILITRITEKATGKKLVSPDIIELLAKIAGWMLITYIIAKTADTVYWAFVTAPARGFAVMNFYTAHPIYNIGILFTEIVVCGFVPGLILIKKQGRENPFLMMTAVVLAVVGCCVNRWVMVLQTMAVPVLPFETWYFYSPSWQEVATTLLPVAYGVILISLAYRYLPVFPQEKELNPSG